MNEKVTIRNGKSSSCITWSHNPCVICLVLLGLGELKQCKNLALSIIFRYYDWIIGVQSLNIWTNAMPPKASKKHRRRTKSTTGHQCHIQKGKKSQRATLETFRKRDMIAKRAAHLCYAYVHKLENDKSFGGFLPCKETDQNKLLVYP